MPAPSIAEARAALNLLRTPIAGAAMLVAGVSVVSVVNHYLGTGAGNLAGAAMIFGCWAHLLRRLVSLP